MNKELEIELKQLANDYEGLTRSDFEGVLLVLENKYGVHFQELHNKVAEIIIRNRIAENKLEEKSYAEQIEIISMYEKEFDCEINICDDYSITFLYE